MWVFPLCLLPSCTSQGNIAEISDVRYHAVIESGDGMASRVYADGQMRVLWNEGDRISIFQKNTYNDQFVFLGDNGDAAGDFELVESSSYHTGNDLDYNYAVYPYNSRNTSDNDANLTVTLPSTQVYKENSFGIGANTMVAKSDGLDLHFKNVGGYLSFKLYGEGVSVSKVSLKGNNGELLAGRAVIAVEDGLPVIKRFRESDLNSESIDLECDPPVALEKTAEESKEFWFVVPPIIFEEGFTVSVTASDGSVFTKKQSSAFEVVRSYIKRKAPIQLQAPEAQTYAIPEMIDLGLSVLWANFDLGATCEGEYGHYFAWGETEPKDSYDWSTYKWCEKVEKTLTKYCFHFTEYGDTTPWGYEGFTDDKYVLDSSDDAAHVNLGGNWRMPSKDEWEELIANCTYAWETIGEVTGRRFTSVKNKKSIFLPSSGYYTTKANGAGTYGDFWSTDLYSSHPGEANHFYFYGKDGQTRTQVHYRCWGMPIRPVADK